MESLWRAMEIIWKVRKSKVIGVMESHGKPQKIQSPGESWRVYGVLTKWRILQNHGESMESHGKSQKIHRVQESSRESWRVYGESSRLVEFRWRVTELLQSLWRVCQWRVYGDSVKSPSWPAKITCTGNPTWDFPCTLHGLLCSHLLFMHGIQSVLFTWSPCTVMHVQSCVELQ